MRRKRKIFYTVKIPHYWYSCRFRKWIHESKLEEQPGDCSNVQFFRTCKVFQKSWPADVLIMKWFYRKGQRYSDIYVCK